MAICFSSSLIGASMSSNNPISRGFSLSSSEPHPSLRCPSQAQLGFPQHIRTRSHCYQLRTGRRGGGVEGHSRMLLQVYSQSSLSSGFMAFEEEEGLWQRVQLLERLLGVAVAEENYTEAKRVGDQLNELKAHLSDVERLLLTNLNILRIGSSQERVEAICTLGDIGDKRALPSLVVGLREINDRIVSETEKAMWKIFMQSDRNDIDELLKEGVSFMVTKDFTSAREVFSKVIQLDPHFAEGWNKRATACYLMQDYEASIEDCRQTLELNPYHFAALSGMGLCYIALRDLETALFWFEKAYAMHPGLTQISRYIEALKLKLAESDKEAEKGSDENFVD